MISSSFRFCLVNCPKPMAFKITMHYIHLPSRSSCVFLTCLINLFLFNLNLFHTAHVRSAELPECLQLPSAFRLFSRNAISILGGATTVLFSVCARYFLPSCPFTRIFSLLACASPRLEQLPTSKYFFCRRRPCFNVQRFHFQVCQVTGAALQSTNRNIQRYGTDLRCSATVCRTTSCSPPACRQRSSPVSRTDGYGKHLSPRCREHLSLYGSRENSWSVSSEALPPE